MCAGVVERALQLDDSHARACARGVLSCARAIAAVRDPRRVRRAACMRPNLDGARHRGCCTGRAMAADAASLVRRDHDELDRILARMVDPAIPVVECAGLVENLQLGFTAHAAAQGTVLRRLMGNLAPPPALLRATV